MQKIIAILFLMLGMQKISAQNIIAPDLNCVSNLANGDVVLNWSIPNNSCGPFISYTIYYATALGGPYIAFIPAITNQLQTTFTHVGANGNNITYYYYMVSNYNCSGAQLTSDTIDNLDPIPPTIISASVSNSLAQLSWLPSTSPETFGYIVYHVIGIANIPVDTLYGANNTTFTDFINSPESNFLTYTVATIDSCGNAGTINITPHHTIFASAVTNDCGGYGVLSWNAYTNWTAVKKYEVYASYNNAAAVLLDSTTALTDTFIYNTVPTSLYVIAYENNSTATSISNVFDITPNSQTPVTNLFLRNVTVVSMAVNRLFYQVDPASNVLAIKIERSDDGLDFSAIDAFNPPANLNGLLVYNDSTAITDFKSYYYRVVMKDNCGFETASNAAKTILLNGYSFSNYTNSLSWDYYLNDSSVVNDYILQRNSFTGWLPIQTFPLTQTAYEENVETLVGDTGTLCYVVKAAITTHLPDGTLLNDTSRSNELCLDQLIKIGVPNAFAPEGKNKIFKPVLRFTGNKSYQFDIYNRWGGVIFSTKDFNIGWDGKVDGKIVEQGAYAFYIQIVDSQGQKTERKGSVIVLR